MVSASVWSRATTVPPLSAAIFRKMARWGETSPTFGSDSQPKPNMPAGDQVQEDEIPVVARPSRSAPHRHGGVDSLQRWGRFRVVDALGHGVDAIEPHADRDACEPFPLLLGECGPQTINRPERSF